MTSEEPTEKTGLLEGFQVNTGGGGGSRAGAGGKSKPPKHKIAKRKTEMAKRKKGIVLNKDSAMELEYQVQVNLVKHNLAATYFYSRQMLLFTVPQGLLTMSTSILAFLASSQLMSDHTRTILATIVGCFSGIVVFLQTMNGVCTFGMRGAQHASAAIDLRDLRDHIILMKFTLQREDEQDDDEEEVDEDEAANVDLLGPSDDKTVASYDTRNRKSKAGTRVSKKKKHREGKGEEENDEQLAQDDNTFARLQQRYRQSLAGCKSNLPMFISESFHGLNSTLLVMDTIDRKKYMVNVYGKKVVYDNLVYFKAYDLLAEEFLNYWFFPVLLPNPRHATNRAMDALGKTLDKYHSYWDVKERHLKKIMLEQIREDMKMESDMREASKEFVKNADDPGIPGYTDAVDV